jgi:competence protein ComEA
MPKIDSELISRLRQIIPESTSKFRVHIEKKHFISTLLVISAGVALAIFLLWSGGAKEIPSASADSAESGIEIVDNNQSINQPSQVNKILIIDVAGKVKNPDVYELPQGSRVIDAIKAAGGVGKGADSSGVNMARLLEDGEQIYIESGSSPTHSLASTSRGTRGGKVNLNRANLSELDGLPGVGPVLAARIIEWRSKNGNFKSVDELRRVSGIGDAKFNELKEVVVV